MLLATAVGSLVALPTTGAAIARHGTVRVVRLGVLVAALGLSVAAAALGEALPVTVAGLFLYGLGIGVWDVAMNVEGAEVERHLRRTIMPRFHAGFSLGTVVGALLGAGLVALDVPGRVAPDGDRADRRWWWPGRPPRPSCRSRRGASPDRPRSAARAWLEPRTLAIGVLVMAMAMTEGTANDWLAVALVDGYGVSHSVGVAGFAVFVTAMTLTRFVGTGLLDAFGRAAVLWGTIVAAGVGVVLIVVGGHPALVVLGIVLWGAGASLGFPVGMSAAADDPAHAAARVSVVSTIGYAAFLAGPPLLGVRRRRGRDPQCAARRRGAAGAGRARGAGGAQAAGQSSTRRMTRRGILLATASVSPTTSKPQFSNIARVPTKAIVRSMRRPCGSTG